MKHKNKALVVVEDIRSNFTKLDKYRSGDNHLLQLLDLHFKHDLYITDKNLVMKAANNSTMLQVKRLVFSDTIKFIHELDSSSKAERIRHILHSLELVIYENSEYSLMDVDNSDDLHMDIVLNRMMPPVDPIYLQAMGWLDNKYGRNLHNSSQSLHNFDEKISVVKMFPDIAIPSKIISIVGKKHGDSMEWDDKTIAEIMRAATSMTAEYGTIILKPADLWGGLGVEKFESIYEEQITDYLARITNIGKKHYNESYRIRELFIQKYLPGVKQGDFRVIVVNGRAAGGFIRIPATGAVATNFMQGGRPILAAPVQFTKDSLLDYRNRIVKNKLSPEEIKWHNKNSVDHYSRGIPPDYDETLQKINAMLEMLDNADIVGRHLFDFGVRIAGLDFILDDITLDISAYKLTEVNIACPVGFVHYQALLEEANITYNLKDLPQFQFLQTAVK